MVGIGVGVFRLLLLAVLSLGVFGMHTVGHASDHHSWEALSEGTSGHAAGAAEAVMAERVVAEAAMPEAAGPWLAGGADPCDGTCGTAGPVVAYRGAGSDPDGSGGGLVIMCLAVLFGLGVLAMLAGAWARRHRTAHSAASAHRSRSPRAGPGFAPALALRLVDAAVLRI